MNLLDEAEALELIEFDPKVVEGPQVIATFLEKHANQSLSSEEQEAIMKGFHQPNCHAMMNDDT